MQEVSFNDMNGERIATFIKTDEFTYWGGLSVDRLSLSSPLRNVFLQHHYYETNNGMLRTVRKLAVIGANKMGTYEVCNTATYSRLQLGTELRVTDLAQALGMPEEVVRNYFTNTIHIA